VVEFQKTIPIPSRTDFELEQVGAALNSAPAYHRIMGLSCGRGGEDPWVHDPGTV
jgi:hypothetical protein